jgi:hypothetical protein
MEEDLIALMRGTAAISALAGDRVSAFDHPQGKGVPYVTAVTISGAEGLTLKGRDGLTDARAQIDCYDRTRAGAKALARAVITALHGHRGARFRLVSHLGTRDSREGGTNEAERLYRVSLDFGIKWRAS